MLSKSTIKVITIIAGHDKEYIIKVEEKPEIIDQSQLSYCFCPEELNNQNLPKLPTCVQGWAKERSLGCVNTASWLPLATRLEFTQPRDHSFAQPCIINQRRQGREGWNPTSDIEESLFNSPDPVILCVCVLWCTFACLTAQLLD